MADTSEPRLMVCTSHAFLGGKLNLAHAAAVYLPASVDANLGEIFNCPALFATGIDSHGRQGARQVEGLSAAAAIIRKEALVRGFAADLEKLGIQVDVYICTDAPDIAKATTNAICKLQALGQITKTESTTFECSHDCGDLSVSETQSENVKSKVWKSHIEAAKEENLYCSSCGAVVRKKVESQFALDLRGGEEFLRNIPKACSGKLGRKLLEDASRNKFDSWVISRSNYYGLPFPGTPDRQIYLWFPAIISKLVLAKWLDLTPRQFLEGKHAKFYFAKNIVQYYGRILPLLLSRVSEAEQAGYSYHIRGFCDLERSSEMLDCEQTVARYGLQTVRFFCLYTVVDDARDFVLLPEKLRAVEKGVIEGVFMRFLQRFPTELPTREICPEELSVDAAEFWSKLKNLHKQGKIRGILLELEREIQKFKGHELNDAAYSLRHITSVILTIYAPGWQSAWGLE